ncbi:MAG: phosphate transport system protein [Acidimicrobiaceae bacterium]|jgi:phosphate transport system protein
MEGPLRKSFQQDLEAIDARVVQLFALVSESLAAATDTLLAGERDTDMSITAREAIIDELNVDLETVVERNLLLQAPVARDLRFLICALRIVPELERSGDLAEHIATRAIRGLGAQLTPQVRGLVERMGRIGVEMWRAAADAYVERDGEAAARIDQLDDGLDDLHDQLINALDDEAMSRRVAIEMGLVARFYERLGDHAVHISERVRHLAGEPRRT